MQTLRFLIRSKSLMAGLVLAFGSSAAPTWGEEPLLRYFSATQIEEAKDYRRDFAAAATAEEVADLYRQALGLEKSLLAPIREANQTANWPLLDSFREAELNLPALSPSCTAECTEPAFVIELEVFGGLAARTENTADETFFQFLRDVYSYPLTYYGELTGWPVFFEQTWDYGGYSLIGAGSHLEIMKRIDPFTADYGPFAPEINDLRKRLLKDLLEHSRCSGLPAADILEEIDAILQQVSLQGTERDNISERRRQFQDPAKHGIEVDCRQAICPCSSN